MCDRVLASPRERHLTKCLSSCGGNLRLPGFRPSESSCLSKNVLRDQVRETIVEVSPYYWFCMLPGLSSTYQQILRAVCGLPASGRAGTSELLRILTLMLLLVNRKSVFHKMPYLAKTQVISAFSQVRGVCHITSFHVLLVHFVRKLILLHSSAELGSGGESLRITKPSRLCVLGLVAIPKQFSDHGYLQVCSRETHS